MKLEEIIKQMLREAHDDDEEDYEMDDIPDIDGENDLKWDPHTGSFSRLVNVDPESNKHDWELINIPELIKIAGEIRKMKAQLKIFEFYDESHGPAYMALKNIARSALASLNNAEGKIRDLHKNFKIVTAYYKQQDKK